MADDMKPGFTFTEVTDQERDHMIKHATQTLFREVAPERDKLVVIAEPVVEIDVADAFQFESFDLM